MEDEIDLSKYLAVLLRHWKLIAGFTIIAAAAALVVSFLFQPAYEATALITVMHPLNQYQFDPRIQTLPDQQPYKAYPELALTDDLLQQLVATMGNQLEPKERELPALRQHLAADPGADPSLVRLTVTSSNPQSAQSIVNAWASLYITYTNDLYQRRASSAAFFQAQSADAQTQLANAEQALVDYQATNPINIVTAQLNSKQAELSDYLAAQRTIALIVQDARSLQQQLAKQDVNSPSLLADQLSALYLQVDALNSKTDVPIQLQIGGQEPLSNLTVAKQAALLDTLIKVLQNKSLDLQQQITAVQPDILALQKAQQEAQVKLDRLTRQRDVANETYLALTRKMSESSLAAQDNGGGVALVSRASIPTEPVSGRKLLSVLAGGALGLIAGVIAAFVVDRRQTATVKQTNLTALG